MALYTDILIVTGTYWCDAICYMAVSSRRNASTKTLWDHPGRFKIWWTDCWWVIGCPYAYIFLMNTIMLVFCLSWYSSTQIAYTCQVEFYRLFLKFCLSSAMPYVRLSPSFVLWCYTMLSAIDMQWNVPMQSRVLHFFESTLTFNMSYVDMAHVHSDAVLICSSMFLLQTRTIVHHDWL